MQNNINVEAHLHSEVEAIKKHAQQLVQQNTGFVEKIAKIEAQQESIKEKQAETGKRLEAFQDDLTKELRNSVTEIRSSIGERITDINQILISQQDTQGRLIEIQGRQGVQIDEIRKTLEGFTKIQETTNNHETRITTLEKRLAEMEEARSLTQNSQVQGKGATIAAITSAVVSGLLAIVGTILMTVVK